MKKLKKKTNKKIKSTRSDFFKRRWDESWTYIKTVVDVVREPILILNKDLYVLAGNDSFYKMFGVEQEETEGKLVYKLGNGQWDISSLRKLLEDILPKHTFFKGFEVIHEFPTIGRKVMILNARQIHFKEGAIKDAFPSQIILLAIEDVTEMMSVAQKLADHTNQFEEKIVERTKQMEKSIAMLKEETILLKKKLSLT